LSESQVFASFVQAYLCDKRTPDVRDPKTNRAWQIKQDKSIGPPDCIL
jgi:hypothetical protein